MRLAMTLALLTRRRNLFVAVLFLLTAARANCSGQDAIPDLSEASLEQLGNINGQDDGLDLVALLQHLGPEWSRSTAASSVRGAKPDRGSWNYSGCSCVFHRKHVANAAARCP